MGPRLSKPDEACGGRIEDKVRSLRKLLRLPVRHLFPGHGEPVFHKGGSEIKIALIALYQGLHESYPERAWIAMGEDLLEVGLFDEARQCAARAAQVAAQDLEPVKDFYERIAGAEMIHS